MNGREKNKMWRKIRKNIFFVKQKNMPFLTPKSEDDGDEPKFRTNI